MEENRRPVARSRRDPRTFGQGGEDDGADSSDAKYLGGDHETNVAHSIPARPPAPIYLSPDTTLTSLAKGIVREELLDLARRRQLGGLDAGDMRRLEQICKIMKQVPEDEEGVRLTRETEETQDLTDAELEAIASARTE